MTATRTVALISLLAALAACATPDGLYRRTNSSLQECLREGQPRSEAERCLDRASLDLNDHPSPGTLRARRCKAHPMPMLASCVHFTGQIKNGLLGEWHLKADVDGP